MDEETLDDIVEELADKLNIYNACPWDHMYHLEEPDCERNCVCRVGFTSGLKQRILVATQTARGLRGSLADALAHTEGSE